jgi:hypothetical protein
MQMPDEQGEYASQMPELLGLKLKRGHSCDPELPGHLVYFSASFFFVVVEESNWSVVNWYLPVASGD